MASSGNFIPFTLYYHDPKHPAPGQLNNDQQAQAIVDEARKLILAGAPGVAITYSANYGQTLTIHQTYDSGGWNTHTNGGHQAEVMAAMELLMGLPENSDIQMKLRISPISTMSYPPTYIPYQYVFLDLLNIKTQLLDQGWSVLGWRNQGTPAGEYAIGGDIAGKMPDDVHTLIKNVLNLYELQYAPQ
jgi:hypothetical protein